MTTLPRMPLPASCDEAAYWNRVHGCAAAREIAQATTNKTALVIASSVSEANQLKTELEFFADTQIRLLQDWETLPYDIFSPHQDIVSARLDFFAALYRKHQNFPGIFIVSTDTLMQRVPPPEFITSRTFTLKIGAHLDPIAFRRKLDENGYVSTSEVISHGEYAMRGSVFDFFPSGYEEAVRINLSDDEIENLRFFSPDTQISTKATEEINILPAREFPFDQESIVRFRTCLREIIDGSLEESRIYRDVSNGIIPGGIEYYLPLFHRRMATLFDYLDKNCLLFLMEDGLASVEKQWEAIDGRYAEARLKADYPPLEPASLFLPADEFNAGLMKFGRIIISHFKNLDQEAHDGKTLLSPPVAIQTDTAEPEQRLKHFIKTLNGRILIVAETAGYREQLMELLGKYKIHPKPVEGWRDFLSRDEVLCICVGSIHQGVVYEEERLAIINDSQIFGHKAKQRKNARGTKSDRVFKNLGELQLGCPVVHEKYGVGRYLGLQTLDFGGTPAECLVLEYANNEKLYVPVISLNLISRYTGVSPENAPLHKLNGKQWTATKRKAAQKTFDIAAELLDSQARRTASQGFEYQISDDDYRAFISTFPYEETIDQEAAMREVIADMGSQIPMDRIICGDVGFGKTEIAMRAAFIAVENNRQVAILAPTTLLVNQHLQSFTERFADWPVRIEMLSRFLSSREQKQVIESIENGTADIVIATHKLLQKKIDFRNLGLIIIDEEQRFGVRHKEKLKSDYIHSDILTLTATPIPRTLNMSLSGLRELSIIATPPSERLAIKTFVSEWSGELIQEVCQRELRRGGQIYFLHNQISTIQRTAEQLSELLPEVDIRIAHGKMPEKVLESIMLDFYKAKFHLLVCTTIIESGLDIPNANSIIINEANRFGLTQLHQLRGRVGRSHHRAYAYLLLQVPRSQLPGDAKKRLEAIESMEELGSGFSIAASDLEIRGAGDLLGKGQSGHLQEVGFNMYNEMLKRAIDTLKSGQIPDLDKPLNIVTEVDFGEPALIPDDYIPDVNLRLIMYRSISAASDIDELENIAREMIDRFGKLPEYAKNLFANAKVRLRCFELGIQKVSVGPERGFFDFESNPNFNIDSLMEIIRENASAFSFEKNSRLIFRSDMEEIDERIYLLHNLLDTISPPQIP